MAPRVHFQINNKDLLWLFLLLLFQKIPMLWILRHLSSLTLDGPKSSPLLPRTQGLSIMCLPPDPMDVDPSRSYLTDGIRSSPLHFLCSIGCWSNGPRSFPQWIW
jgi:hypothetical protein